jgi:acetyltransferase-like isoleucine patch superfamily enzyme
MPRIHPLAEVQSTEIGVDTQVWQYCVILKSARLGMNCNICAHCFIENDVRIGNNVTIKCSVYLWDGIEIGDDVFIGPNVTFTNDKYPRSKQYPESFLKITVKQGASIGAGAIILGGVTIGTHAMIGAGSIVTRDVPDGQLWIGSPAKYRRDIEYR